MVRPALWAPLRARPEAGFAGGQLTVFLEVSTVQTSSVGGGRGTRRLCTL